MGMAQVLATLAVAVAIIARRTSTRPLQSAQALFHFALGTFGLCILLLDVIVASDLSPRFLSGWLRQLNFAAAGSLLLLMYALGPFFQTKAEQHTEAEARQINKDRANSRSNPAVANGKAGQTPTTEVQATLARTTAAQGRYSPKKSRKNRKG
jgi:hypothetical protein